MEPSEEVLVVIQAESGEEIALPLAALDEQHQEVVLDSDGTTTTLDHRNEGGNENNEVQIYTTLNGFHPDGETSSGGDSKPMVIDSPLSSPTRKPEGPRVKQKRKEKLVCLPLFEDDLTLEFQSVEQQSPPIVEETKRRPRKEYRTKKRLAAALAPQQQEPSETTADLVSNEEASQIDASNDKDEFSLKKAKKEKKEHPEASTPKERNLGETQQASSPTTAQPTSQRRTRLSNSCRVATGKMYKCNDCDFSTERINNIILHMKETCPKIKK